MSFFNKYQNMSKEIKASIAYTVCNILIRCLSFITLPIFTRIMSTEEYGLSTVYMSTAAIVVIFTSLQLPYGSLSTAMIRFKNDRAGYLSALCAISSMLTIIFLVVCFLFKREFVEWLNIPFPLLIVMGIEMLFTSVTTAWMGWQRFEYKYKSVVLVTLSTAVLSVALSLIAVLNSENKGVAKILSHALIVIIFGIFLYIFLICKGKKLFNKDYWKFALTFNIPLIPYYLSQVVFNQSDRLMIDNICGRSDAAIYGVAYSLATILTFVVTSIHSSYTPWIFERIDKKELRDSRRVSLTLSASIAFMLLGIIALAPEIISIMAGEKYISAIWAVPPVTMSVLLLYYADLFDCLLFFYESKEFLAVAAIISAILNVALNALFIPKYGFVAAAYTTLFSYFILAGMDYLYMVKVCKKNNIDINLYSIKGLILIFVMFAGLGFFAMSLYTLPMIRYLIIAVVFIVLMIYRKKLINVYKSLRKGESPE